ncbi:MAG: DUF2891 domain-containing protein [Casimicrobiaceae bacterium]
MALVNIGREYPTKLDHMINGPEDVRSPRELHPLFFGSFDWHSCVHAHWMLARLLRLFPDARFADDIRMAFAHRLTAPNVAGELAYLGQANRGSFVRTYGWAWLLKLAEEFEHGSRSGRDIGRFGEWRDRLAPLTARFVDLYLDYLPRAQVPLRYGIHPNSAFGIAFALDYASTTGHAALRALCIEKALDWYTADVEYPARLEPSGSDFLSPALTEADLMRRVLDRPAFRIWLQRFLPELSASRPASLFTPVDSGDRSDPQMVHLDGLNLSRAWCLRGIAEALGRDDPRHPLLHAAAHAHLEAGMPAVQSGDYMGEHWLATFAVFALTPALID